MNTKTIPLLFRAFGSYKKHLVLAGLIGLLGSAAGSLGAGALIPLLSFVIGAEGGGDQNFAVEFVLGIFSYLPFRYSVGSLLLLVVFLFVLKSVTLFVFSWLRLKIIYDYRTKTMARLLRKILEARWAFLLRQKIGYVQNIIIQDVDKSSSLLGSVAHIVLSSISATVFIFFAFTLSPSVTLVTVAISLVFLLFSHPLLKKIKALRAQYTVESKNLFQYLIEHLGGLKHIKTAAAEQEVLKRGSGIFDLWRGLELKGNVLRSLNKQALEPASVVLVAVIFALSYKAPGFNLQTFVAVIYLIQQTFKHLELAQGALQDINEAIPHAVHLDSFEQNLGLERESNNRGLPFKFEKEISFHNVCFSYGPGEVLSGANFNIRKGEMVGLIGPSGAGKTTVADLVLRLFSPGTGHIFLDGLEAEKYSLVDWRRKMGYVSQDIFLLNDTIENNIKFYNSGVSYEDITAAAKSANIYDFIKELREGFQTVAGDRGIMLSGGQRQRVVLARALAVNPEVLVLDEATSSLDNESETLIRNAIKGLRGKITVFVIAHRLSTVADVDRLLVLDRGKVMEEGKPQELLRNKDSYFYKMYHLKEV